MIGSEAPRIFVLGSVVLACSAKVERLPILGESLLAEALTIETGGKGLNVALAADRLGARVDGILPVGDDPLAEIAEAALARTGLSPAMIRRFAARTGSGIGFTDRNGDNCLAVHPGANRLLTTADIRAAVVAISGSDLVTAQFEIPDAPVSEAFSLARAHGRPTLLNPSPFRPVDRRILANTSIIVVNMVEAVHLAKEAGLTAKIASQHEIVRSLDATMPALHAAGPDTIVVTLGAAGAVAYCRDRPPIRQPAFAVAAIDTLGAGDAFTAGFAVGMIEGRPLPECLERASACAAITVQSLGVFAALPTRAQVDAFLDASVSAPR